MSDEHRKMGHVQSKQVYLSVLGALVALTIITVAVSKVDFGVFNTLVALFVAGVKASLVINFFMHGRFEDRVTWTFIWYPLILLMTLIGALFLDYGFRNPEDRIFQAPSYESKHAGDAHGESTHDAAPGDHGKAEESQQEKPADQQPPAEENQGGDSANNDHGDKSAAISHEKPEGHDVWANLSGDVDLGRAQAKSLCIGCHVVDGAGNALAGAPPFSTTANDPTKTPDYISQWLKNPQKLKPGTLMPMFNLQDGDIQNLVAYLGTYRGK